MHRSSRLLVTAAVLMLLLLVPARASVSGISPLYCLVASSAVIVKARITHAQKLTEAVAFSAAVLAVVKTDGQAAAENCRMLSPTRSGRARWDGRSTNSRRC